MQYAILEFRYANDMTIIDYKPTHEEAVKEIDRLAKIESNKKRWFSDPCYYTFMPVGGQ